jgi:PAS domain S-box-containing protein
MEDKDKTKAQLINEVKGMRLRIAHLENQVSLHNKIQEGLRKQKEKRLAMFYSLTPRIWHIDLEGRIVRTSRSASESLALPVKDVIGRKLEEFLPPHEALKFKDDMERIIRSGEPELGVVEARSFLPSGNRGWALCDKVPYYDKHGEIAGIIVYAVDISERIKAQEALRVSTLKLSEALDLAHIVNWEADPITGAFTFNDPFYSFYGTTAEREGGYVMSRDEYARRFVHPEDIDEFYRFVERTRQRAEPDLLSHLEHRIIDHSGKVRHILARTRIIRGPTGNIVRIYGANQDITDRKQMEEEKRHLEMQLLQARKMEALGTLAGGIAHDFNNILEGIIGFAEMIREDSDVDKPLHRRIGLVLKGAHRGRDLVKQILTFSRQKGLGRKPAALWEVVQEGLKLLRPALPSTIEIRSRSLTDDDTVSADPVQLHQVLMNLCMNAAYAMREKGGLLEIDVSNVKFETGDPLPLPEIEPGEYVVLTVRDTGCGMGPDTIDRIFDPFFTAKPLGEGTGLGLAVVHGIIKSHNGHVVVQSELGKGSTFCIYLPKIERQARLEGQEAGAIPGGKESVLFIDDEDILVDLNRERLSGLGYNVVATTSAVEALEIFKRAPYRFDLVITDYTMPYHTGMDLAAEFLRIRKDIPIILCTGHNDNVSPESARAAGIQEFLMKPQSRDELAQAVRRVLDAAASP